MANNGVYFDGTNDYLSGNGFTNGTEASFFFFFKPDNTQQDPGAINNRIMFQLAGRTNVTVDGTQSGGKFRCRVFWLSDSDATVLTVFTTYVFTPDEWNLLLFSYDSVTQTLHMYDGNHNDVYAGSGTTNTGTLRHALSHTIGGTAGADNYTGALQNFWHTDEAVDWSSTANFDKVVRSDGRPNLTGIGSDGSGITGTQARYYFKDDHTSFETNYGSVANFTENGTVTDEGTEPILPGYAAGPVAGSFGLMGVGI